VESTNGLRTVAATRYVTPLREGGSLPGLVEADDLGMYVLKFRGAGQGIKALTAEIIVGELARRLGFRVPEIVLVNLDPELARAEPDEEVQDLLRNSGGLNLGLDYLPGSFDYNPVVREPGEDLATRLLWLDALTLNVDRCCGTGSCGSSTTARPCTSTTPGAPTGSRPSSTGSTRTTT
jgi:hypothetical protein